VRTPELDLFERLKGAQDVKPTAPSEGSTMEKEIAKTDPDFSTPLTIRNLFTHHDTHPVVIDFALLKTYGPQWLGWDTTTVLQEIQKSFASQISEHSRAKIQAVKTLHIVNSPWDSWQVFEKVIQALNNNVPKWEHIQAPSLEQLYAGIDIMNAVRAEEFSDEVKAYIAASILNEDVFYVPPPLDFVQMEVSKPYYVCMDCDNADSALFHDGLCDTCTHKFLPENGLSFTPDPELVAQGKGKNLKLLLTFDPDPIEKRWNEVKNSPSDQVELKETQVDVQVAKLLVARDYLNIRRRQLAEQLTALKSWLGVT
jgi:hypothetical protein